MKMYTNPVTGMRYKKVGNGYYFKSKWYGGLSDGWIKSGMRKGFVPC